MLKYHFALIQVVFIVKNSFYFYETYLVLDLMLLNISNFVMPWLCNFVIIVCPQLNFYQLFIPFIL